jgi:hypothetical protein
VRTVSRDSISRQYLATLDPLKLFLPSHPARSRAGGAGAGAGRAGGGIGGGGRGGKEAGQRVSPRGAVCGGGWSAVESEGARAPRPRSRSVEWRAHLKAKAGALEGGGCRGEGGGGGLQSDKISDLASTLDAALEDILKSHL